MSGLRSGVATRIQQLESRAIYTHCYGHSLNLAAGDTIKKSTVMKKALDITLEMSKLIKFLPKRDALFQNLKEELQPECPGMRVLCPTRWTVRADSLKSVLDNYSVLQELWEESEKLTKDSETTARIIGVASQMATFDFYFGVYISEMILRHSDNLSKALQKKDISAAEGQHVASLVKTTLQTMRSESSFSLFWQVLSIKAQKLNIGEPTLPRKRKAPKIFEVGIGEAGFHVNVEEHYRAIYYEALDLIIQCIDDRFDQVGYRMYMNLETLLLKGCKQVEHSSELEHVKELYSDDIHYGNLEVQFQTIAPVMK
ncbi:zinc finger MYM-type protein 1-like [Dysidea avara]|uniref:zinc finger MYM-type protein 1-like n=1 Tax=Dysidea avara TaxID=196820 RepID=UPI0033182BEB